MSGTFNTVLDVDATSFLTSLTVSGGAGAHTLTTATAFANTIVEMGGVASNVKFTTGGTTQTVTTGTGNDSITMNAGVKTVVLGSGNDTLTTTIAELGTAATSFDSLDGGVGTDTLSLSCAAAITAEAAVNISGFERLDLTAVTGVITQNMAVFSDSFDRITVGDTNDNLVTLQSLASTFSDLRFTDPGAGDDSELALERLVDSTTNSLTVTLAGGTILQDLVIDHEETVTVQTTGAAGVTLTDLDAADMTSLTILGSNAVVASDISSTALATVDATTATGAVTVSAANSTVAVTATGNALAGGAFTFTGGSGADVITGGLVGDVLSGGNGIDIISGRAGADDILGGDGADNLTGGGGLDAFFYDAANVATQGADTITDSTASQGDEISVDIATAGGAGGTADALVLVDAAGEAAAGITNADLVVIEDVIIIDTSGNAAADLAAINLVLSDGGDDEAAANAEFVVILNADTNGDGAADAVQAYYMHETGGANSQADASALIATFSNIAGTTDLTTLFSATNAEFL